MYTNGYTKAPYQSLVVVTGFNWSPNPFNTHVMTTTAFADQSEHITLETPADGNGSYYTRDSEPLRIYTGI